MRARSCSIRRTESARSDSASANFMMFDLPGDLGPIRLAGNIFIREGA